MKIMILVGFLLLTGCISPVGTVECVPQGSCVDFGCDDYIEDCNHADLIRCYVKTSIGENSYSTSDEEYKLLNESWRCKAVRQ